MSRYTFWAQRGHTGNIRHTKHTMGTPEIMYIAQLTLGTGHTGRVPRQSGSCPSVSRYTALQLESIKATCSTVDRQKETHIYICEDTQTHAILYIKYEKLMHTRVQPNKKNANKYAHYIYKYIYMVVYQTFTVSF